MTAFQRKPENFADQLFDVLVIGGGINGAGIAWDAALRGLSVALIEKGDFGGGASAGCFKIVHGGLRYLQHLDFTRLRKSVREQRTLRRIGGNFIKPLPFLVPCYGNGVKGRGFLRLGLSAYELLSLDRNSGVAASQHLPRHSVLSMSEVLERAPGLPSENLRGGVIFFDAQMRSSDRLILAVAKSAAAAGASVANYLELLSAEQGSGPEWRVTLRDNISGGLIPVRARAIVNAGGAAGGRVLERLNLPGLPPRNFVRGVQFIFPPLLGDCAVAVESGAIDRASVVRRGGRSYFFVPWEGFTLAGTFEAPTKEPSEPFRITPEERAQFLRELQTSYEDDRLVSENIVSVFGGFIPVERGSLPGSANYRVDRNDEVRDLSRDKILLSVTGVKYTTFRSLAESVVDRVAERLRLPADRCKTAETLLEGAGDELRKIDTAMLESELSRSIREEMTCRLSDFIFRRLPLAAQGIATPDMIDVLSGSMGSELAWSQAKLLEERETAKTELFATCPESYSALRVRESVGA